MRKVVLTIAAVGLLVQSSAFAQTSPASQPSTDSAVYRVTGTRVAIAQDVRIERDEEVSDTAVVIGGDLTVDGRVRDGIVVVGGNLHLGSTADVRGDIVLVGGTITRDPGARHSGGTNFVSFGRWWSREFGWWPTVRFGQLSRWLTLAGTLARVSVLGLLMAALLLVARAPVARVGRAALAEPVKAFIIGLAAEIFFVPALIAASIALAVTIIGIPFVAVLVPVAIVLLVFAFTLGFTALACRLGEWVEDRLGWQPGNAFIATAIGFLILIGPTVLARFVNVATTTAWPLTWALIAVGLTVEFFAWTTGLGAAIVTGLGRWYTVPPPITVKPVEPTASATAF
jgi:hypothetical protein